MIRVFIITLVLAISLPISVSAHPGRTDSKGCHTCKTDCENWGLEYGEYHCHSGDTYTNSAGAVYYEDGTLLTPAPQPDPVVIDELPPSEPAPASKPIVIPETSTNNSPQDDTTVLENVIDEIEAQDDIDEYESEDVPWTVGATIMLIIMLAIVGGIIYGIYKLVKSLTHRIRRK